MIRRRLDRLILPLAAILALLALSGCLGRTRTTTAEIERTVGVQAGQPTDLTTTRRSQAEATTSLELGPLVQAAVAAATGDLRSSLTALAQRPAPASADDLAQAVASALPSPPSAAALAEAVASALPAEGPISPETTGAALLAILTTLAAALKDRENRRLREDEARRLRADNDEAYARLLATDRPAAPPAGAP